MDRYRGAPTGEVTRVGVDELFFSTTDRRGVITSANSVFVRLSHFPEEQLLGAPHNIIRHPEMPAGAFHVMWDRILSGRIMAAHVLNLAGDGSTYTVYATITPLGDGFLSVRSAPMRPDLWEVVSRVYASSLATERSARAEGAPRAEAARAGATELTRALAEEGFAGVDDLIRTVLPAEVEARGRALDGRPEPSVDGGFAPAYAAASDARRELGALMARLDDYLALADSVERTRAGLEPVLAAMGHGVDGAARAAALTEQRVLVTTATASADLAAAAEGELRGLAPMLASVRETVLDLRVTIAMSTLHADMARDFAREASTGAGIGDPATNVARLAVALGSSVDQTEAALQAAHEGLVRIADAADAGGQRLAEFQRMLGQWRHLVLRTGASSSLAGHLDPVDRQVSAGATHMSELRKLGEGCRRASARVDLSALRSAVDALRAGVPAP